MTRYSIVNIENLLPGLPCFVCFFGHKKRRLSDSLPVWKKPEKRRFAFFYFSPRRIAKPVSGKVMATMGRK